MTLKAPFDGIVAEISIELGEWTTPSPPAIPVPAVVDILDPTSLYISAPMDEVDSGRVRTGQTARVTIDSHRDQSFDGLVTRVAPYVLDLQEQNRTVEIEIELGADSPIEEFLPGTSADVEVILEVKEDALRIPTAALMEGSRVLMVTDGELTERSLTTGLKNWDFVEVIDGLAEGDSIVTSLDRAEVKAGARGRGRRRPVIELAEISRTFTVGDRPVYALREVTETIAEGEHIAIMGASGSGKSTLLNIVGCLDRPTSGTYTLDGRSVGDLSQAELTQVRRHKIGFVFQSFHLVPRLTATENVELPMIFADVSRRERHRRSEAALEGVGLANRAAHLPDQLSGGERQRVAMARAMVMQPSILLADEPTGNLDSKSGRAVLDLLEGLNDQGLTLIVVTHDVKVARRADRIIVLLDGQIVKRVRGDQISEVLDAAEPRRGRRRERPAHGALRARRAHGPRPAHRAEPASA